MKARECIAHILEEFDKRKVSLESIVDKALSQENIDHRDRRFIFEITYGIVRNRLRLNYILDHFLTDKHFNKNTHLMRYLQIGAYQILYLDRVPDHAAVNESVNLAKREKATLKYVGVINAVLRKIVSQKNSMPKPHIKEEAAIRLSIQFSHPQWLIKRWLKQFGLTNTKRLLEFNNKQPDIFLRRKIKELSRQQFESEIRSVCETPGVGYKNLYYRLKKNHFVEEIRMFQFGHCTVQSSSSGWATALLDIKKDEKLLDVCSAPGGKSTLMADLVGPQGAVCACELRAHRLVKVQESIDRMGLSNIFPIIADGKQLPFTGQFDKILLDAPCSGTGVMNHHPDARWFRTADDIKRIIKVQRELLEGVAPFVVPGGILVYATCSLEPEENWKQVERFLESHKEFTLDNLTGTRLVTDTFVDNKGYLFINPFEHKMDGMFAARLKRVV